VTAGFEDTSAPRLTPPVLRGPRPRNDDVTLRPQPSPGHVTVEFDFRGVEVGAAEYAEGPTGVTVIHVPAGARMAIDERGGAIGLVSGDRHFTHAIALAGGSVYGLAAAAGVADELLARRSGCVDWGELALVSGAIIYDFSPRDTAISPDAALGRAALRWAVPGQFPVGRCGAGRAASVGKADYARCEFAGQGAAFRQVGEVRILAMTVVNAVGVIVDRSGRVVRGNYDAATGMRRPLSDDYKAAFAAAVPAPGAPGNTTLSVVATNVRLADRDLEQFGRQVHSSMHRAIQPFHTALDGDTLFALTTDEIDLPSAPSQLGQGALNTAALGALAAETMWDAVLSSAR
jgi:6-aminohexanoate-oligomer endohydrolase